MHFRSQTARKKRGAVFALVILLFPFLATAPAWAGPRWWKISDGGGSVLWIMGMPDGMPMDTDWDQASLRRRLAVAGRLFSPLLGAPMNEADPHWTPGAWTWLGSAIVPPHAERARDPFSYAVSTSPGVAQNQTHLTNLFWLRTLGRGWSESLSGNRPPQVKLAPIGPVQSFKDPLSSRLSPGMMSRVNAAMPKVLGEVPTALRNGRTWEMALWLDLWNWPRNKLLGNPVTTEAQRLAKNARLPIDIIYVPALWKPILLDPATYPADKSEWADFDWLWDTRPSLIEPPEALQQKCLAQVLDQTESKAMPAARMAGVAAWASGDVDHALKRSNSVQLCLMGELPSTSAQDFEVRQALIYIQALDRAFEQKGTSVALVEFDALLLEDGGVLDHFRRLGFDITTGDGME